MCAVKVWGILPYARKPDENGCTVSDADAAAAVLKLVDRGWIEVCRLEPRTSSTGAEGVMYGPALPRADLDELLTDPATWAKPIGSWVGALALSETNLLRGVTRMPGP